jgi:hypothetical protein
MHHAQLVEDPHRVCGAIIGRPVQIMSGGRQCALCIEKEGQPSETAAPQLHFSRFCLPSYFVAQVPVASQVR